MKKTIKLLGIIALVVVIGFSMAGCSDPSGSDSGTIPAAWRGTWTGGGSNTGVSIIFTSTTLRVQGGDAYFTLGSVVITDGTTTHSNSTAWPNNYKVTGTVIESSGGEQPSVGASYDFGQIYFNSGYTHFVVGYTTVAPNIFAK